MQEHVWVIETLDGGHVGLNDFWHCPSCEASGGPVWDGCKPPTLGPFYADGSGLQVSSDCAEARFQIQEHRETWVPPAERLVKPPAKARVGVARSKHPKDILLMRNRRDGAMLDPHLRHQPHQQEVHDLSQSLWGSDPLVPDEREREAFSAYCKEDWAAIERRIEAHQAEERARYDAWRAAGGVHNGG